jgi:YHS domain-containing protein
MFRGILYLIVAVVFISILRSVIGIITKGFAEAFHTSAAESTPRRPSVPAGGELKKDPVCGTFISTATSLSKQVRGETYYFCSATCRDKFNA